MRSFDLRSVFVTAVIVGLTAGCQSGGDGMAEGMAAKVTPPPVDQMFEIRLVPVDANQDGFIDERDDLNGDGVMDVESRAFFNARAFAKYCAVPDADSFDDYEKVDANTGRVLIPRGVTPFDSECEADGIETGPLTTHDTLIPSKWCRTDCSGSPSK